MVSCSSKDVKECFPEVNRCERKGRHVKEHLAEADTGERIFCYSKHVKGHGMKDSLIMTHMYCFDLTV